MFEISIKGDIASAHHLREYEGKCKELHGHTWKIEVFLRGEKLDKLGMVTDFSLLKQKFKDFLKAIDHVNLNDLDHFKSVNPTAENIAKYIFDYFGQELRPLDLVISKVQVWESDMASAIYHG